MDRYHSRKKVIIGVIVAILAIVAFWAVLNFFENRSNNANNDETANADEVQQVLYLGDDEYEITHKLETYLMIGTDDSGNEEAEGTKDYRGSMGDFLMLLILDRTADTFGMVQIDRNTMTDVPLVDTDGNGEGEAFEQICTAHWYGGKPAHGCNNTVYTVSQLFGRLHINGYYSIHMSNIGKLNHAVDGVEVTLDTDFTDEDPAMKKGKTMVLNDKQAEIFVRGRMGVDDGTNASRMSRQQIYLEAFQEKAKQKLASDKSFVTDIYTELEEEAVTDITNNRASYIANRMNEDTDLGIMKIEGKTKIGTTLDDGLKHEEFYPKTKSIAEIMVKLCGIEDDHIILYEDMEEE